MIDPTLPQDSKGATEALEQRKIALLTLHSKSLEHNYTQAFQVTGHINNMIDNIDSRIESGDLWSIEDE